MHLLPLALVYTELRGDCKREQMGPVRHPAPGIPNFGATGWDPIMNTTCDETEQRIT